MKIKCSVHSQDFERDLQVLKMRRGSDSFPSPTTPKAQGKSWNMRQKAYITQGLMIPVARHDRKKWTHEHSAISISGQDLHT